MVGLSAGKIADYRRDRAPMGRYELTSHPEKHETDMNNIRFGKYVQLYFGQLNRDATLRNRCNAASKLSAISAAISSGGGVSGSSRLASLSQKMSRLSLSRLTSSA